MMKAKLISGILITAMALSPLELSLKNNRKRMTVQYAESQAAAPAIAIPVGIAALTLTAITGIYILSSVQTSTDNGEALYELLKPVFTAMGATDALSRTLVLYELNALSSLGTTAVRFVTIQALKVLLENSYTRSTVKALFMSLNVNQTRVALDLILAMEDAQDIASLREITVTAIANYLGIIEDFWKNCNNNERLISYTVSSIWNGFFIFFIAIPENIRLDLIKNALKSGYGPNSSTIMWDNEIKHLSDIIKTWQNSGNNSTNEKSAREAYRILKRIFLKDPSLCPDDIDPILQQA